MGCQVTDPIDSPDHVLVCGERVERHSVDHEHATYGHPLAVVRVAYWPAHGRPWHVILCITRPSGALVHYHASATSLGVAAHSALYECTDEDVAVVLSSLRAMGEVAHA